ncbi:DUF2269 domain-containing protein [Barrientosiimonas marina]|uniref:DUF2269 family protein n=1 Tax=Lentibacillus kimchii TaxID=1542911 RepID=A0ABW2UVI2_9BACI
MSFLVFIHITAAIIFVGNIITAAFWKVKAAFSKDETHIHLTAKNIMTADHVFTLPGIIVLLISGFILAADSSYTLHAINWLSVSLALFALTGVIWAAILLPLQRKMIHYSGEPFNQASYQKASRIWDVVGSLSTIIPLIILYLMIAKPF